MKVTDTHGGDVRPKTVPDQVMLHGTLLGGTAVSVHYRGGVSKGTNLLWEINGTKGDIQIIGDLGHAQIVQLSVKCAGEDDHALKLNMPDDSEYEGWPEMAAARNVARAYSKLHDDITTGSKTVPSFASAVKLHSLLDKIERSAKRAN